MDRNNPILTERYEEINTGLWARKEPAALKLENVEGLIFDIDGVLVDVGDSFRNAISRTVQYYFNEFVGLGGEEPLLVGKDETSLFKLAGNFNNDWDLTNAAVAFYLMKYSSADCQVDNCDALRSLSPSLEEFTSEVKTLGGGLQNAVSLIENNLENSRLEKFEELYQPKKVQQLFMELYSGGNLCKSLYGFEPEIYKGPGLVEKEKYLIDQEVIGQLVGKGIVLGVMSGRIPSEATHAMEMTGLDHYMSLGFMVTDDGTLPTKPDPAGLETLSGRMGFHRAIYLGDTPDDWSTVVNFNKAHKGEMEIAGCMTGPGEMENRMLEHFTTKGADFIAEDVNALLRALV